MNDTTPPSDDTVKLDPENPWLGLFSYTEENRAYFHGRDEEAAELARRVQRKLLTVLFGQSGLGTLVATSSSPAIWPAAGNARALFSQVGCVMFDKEAFQTVAQNAGGTGSGSLDANNAGAESAVDGWIDTNTSPLFINRYSGTVMSSQ